MTNSSYLDSIDKNLDTAESQLKSLDFKNLDREIKNFGLNTMDNLYSFQKLVLTDQEISISILIGLNCWDPQAYHKLFNELAGRELNADLSCHILNVKGK